MFDSLHDVQPDEITRSMLSRLIDNVRALDDDFAGLGLVICKDQSAVSHLRMYPCLSTRTRSQDICSDIAGRFRLSNPQHDGFDLITPSWNFIERGVFLAPPISDDIRFGKRLHGSRHVTAILTSRLPGVNSCITISGYDGVLSVFQEGDCIVSTVAIDQSMKN